jgi:hypothetical protein
MATSGQAEKRPRPPNMDFSTQNCPGDWKAMCQGLDAWGKAMVKWGNSVLDELDELKDAVCHLEQVTYYGATWSQGTICDKNGRIVTGGTPPTNSTQPPPPPFKP